MTYFQIKGNIKEYDTELLDSIKVCTAIIETKSVDYMRMLLKVDQYENSANLEENVIFFTEKGVDLIYKIASPDIVDDLHLQLCPYANHHFHDRRRVLHLKYSDCLITIENGDNAKFSHITGLYFISNIRSELKGVRMDYFEKPQFLSFSRT